MRGTLLDPCSCPPSTSYQPSRSTHHHQRRQQHNRICSSNRQPSRAPGPLQAVRHEHSANVSPCSGLSRRKLLQALTAAIAATPSGSACAAAVPGAYPQQASGPAPNPKCESRYAQYLSGPPDWTRPGPLQVVHLPRLEHTCVSCFPACVGTSCLVRVDIAYPKGGTALGLGPPYPLAIFSSGFLVSSDSYRSYADTLASWGWTVMLYDRQETVADLLDDVACVTVISDLINWCTADPLLRRIADTQAVFLAGHSRGGKLSALAAAADPRVAAVCLIDAVDNTVYAPLAPGFPSAIEALRRVPPAQRAIPVAVVGSGLGGDCAPQDANYSRFYAANKGPTWEVGIGDAGHFSFLDQRSPLQRAVCAEGGASEDAVRRVSQAVMVAWAETMVRQRGLDVAARGLPPYPGACQQQQQQPSLPGPRIVPKVAGLAASAQVGPALPTWSTPLPQFNEDTLGPKKAAWQTDGGAGAPADLASQRAAAALRERVAASLEASTKEAAEGGHHACPTSVDASLQEALNGMLGDIKTKLQLAEVGSRYKNFL